MDCGAPTSPQRVDPRVSLLRAQLLKAQQDVIKWSETSAQWKASADRRLAREQEQIVKYEELKKELEQTRKRHWEEKEEWKQKFANKKAAVVAILEDTEQAI